MTDWAGILQQIGQAIGAKPSEYRIESLGGGCINRAARVTTRDASYFVKLNTAERQPMFEAEALGLEALANAQAIRTPKVICSGMASSDAFLVLEHIQFGGKQDQEAAGRQLATLHRTTGRQFGWHRDNTLGTTPQINQPANDWVRFWHDHRLGFQLALAAKHGYQGQLQEQGRRLMTALPQLLNHEPAASLLHGDLWSGNLGYDQAGQPVIFDPAVYCGDREADLAMTELFGGFSRRFYDAYEEVWRLDTGYRTRKTLYNLYHILNHLNLFGGGYAQQALSMINRLLAEVG